jgi:hypothetical protein
MVNWFQLVSIGVFGFNWGLTKPVHRFYIGKSAAGVDKCPKSLTTHLNFPTVFVAAAAARSCQRLKRRQVKPRSQKPMSFLKEAPEVESAGNIESQHHPPPKSWTQQHPSYTPTFSGWKPSLFPAHFPSVRLLLRFRQVTCRDKAFLRLGALPTVHP